jgi:hypothetical protein
MTTSERPLTIDADARVIEADRTWEPMEGE